MRLGTRRAEAAARLATILTITIGSIPASALETPAESGSGSESAPPQRRPQELRADLDEHVAAVLRRKEAMSLPRFEEKLEIRDRFREALAEHLQGVDLACGAVSGVPTHKEMQQHRGTSIPPHLDLVRAYKELRKLWRKVRRPKPRFFLYAAHSLDRVGWVLREGEMPATARVAAGASFELLAGFADREEGLAALRRLERGFGSLKRSHEDEPMPPWVTAACRPAAIR